MTQAEHDPLPEAEFVPLPPRHRPDAPPEEAARAFREVMASRRTVRMFSDEPVDRAVIEEIVGAACTAPSGANKQPWRFVAVSDRETKARIRRAAEEAEREFYAGRAGRRWLQDLAPLGTDETKDYIEIAPWLLVVFRLTKDDDGGQVYYTHESVGIAVGMLLCAIHHAGLVTVTHTPSPMGFLRRILGRPEHEKPFLLLPVGHPADDCEVPTEALGRKSMDQVLIFDPPPVDDA